ncbi:MAG: hypothetical protein KUG77_23740 [Nannocystaceae bacterium]|nr:hypothetical protein [Nannocystaceae bacterium]
MSAFLDRAFRLSVADDTQGVRAQVDYRSIGDVTKAPGTCDAIGNADRIVWDLALEKNATASSDYFLVSMPSLDLATTDVPDTMGNSWVDLTAYQNGVAIWTWSAHAQQGQVSTYDPLPSGAVVSETLGTLKITNFYTSIPVQFAAGATQTDVQLVMAYRGKGERL